MPDLEGEDLERHWDGVEWSTCLDLAERFVDETDPSLKDQGLKLGEECGEVAREILKHEDAILFEHAEDECDLEEEVGQALYTLLTIAVIADFDPLQALYRTSYENKIRLEHE